MKKTKLLLFAFLILILTIPVYAEPPTESTAQPPKNPTAFVTVSDETGALVLAGEKTEVTDRDGDNKLTANDALIIVHETFCKDGYAYKKKGAGYEITKLLGVPTDGNIGIFIDGTDMTGGSDYLFDGDTLQVFFYRDSEKRSDRFAYFTKDFTTLSKGNEKINLFAYEKTKEGNLMAKPVENAEITVNGKKTGIKTDKNGEFVLSVRDLAKGQKNVISAVTSDFIMVPPVLIAEPSVDAVPSMHWGKAVFLPVGIFLAVMILGMGIYFTVVRKKKK